ncbi:9829_t:CDS:2 [Entrophospora sp. SA101]|nr:9829_t:CDS:2 [Entrophospora sp. SA101]
MIIDQIVFTFISIWSLGFIFILITQKGKHQSTKSSYPIKSSTSPLVKIPDKCELIQLQLVARHGTRNPTFGDIKKFDSLVEKLTNTQQNWSHPYHYSQAGLLVAKGEEELYLLGKRSRSRYKKFWQNITYDPNIIKFQSSSVARTGQSGIAYSLGLFTGYGTLSLLKLQPIYVSFLPRELDTELSMHRSCPKWVSTLNKSKNKHKLEQEKNYLNFNVTSISKHLSRKLNIQPPLEPKYLEHIYRICGYDISLFDRSGKNINNGDGDGNGSRWCNLLRNDDVLSLEYFNDIGYYFLYSYGNQLNTRLACRFFTGLVNEVENLAFNKSKTKAVLRFAHAETILFIITMLDLYKDGFSLNFNLTSDQVSLRKFKTSKIAPFGSNIYFEIYQSYPNQK